ncbi:MAG: abortive infection family protein [Flavobacterium sp.]|uniref:abortive infection family protein n=1 Tax=Flavobacterium sp. TaxID=239 RepID=UPI0037876151
MAELDYKENFLIEKLFEMPTGYVMDFSNNTFQSFIFDSIKVNIYDDKYFYGSGSKANRLRGFFKEEPNYKTGQLLSALLDYWYTKAIANEHGFNFERDKNIYTECLKIAQRLKEEKIVDEIEVIKEINDDRDFNLLAKSIRESIDKNEPESALDRLHTYVIKYIRQLCENHGIEIKKDESLNAIFGKYVKFIVANEKIESQMTERILKYSIHVLEAFNDVRNNRSFAHDNEILNYSESVLIFNNVTNSIKFIETIEKTIQNVSETIEAESTNWEDLPF